jgi:error-prone DNA polymerase
MGLIKVDLLGLGMMAVLQDALQMVNTGLLGAPAAAAEGESSSPEAEKMMAVLQDALQMVNERDRDSQFAARSSHSVHDADSSFYEPRTANREPRDMVDLAHLPPNDPAVYTMLQEADTVGLFQVESRSVPKSSTTSSSRWRSSGRDRSSDRWCTRI